MKKAENPTFKMFIGYDSKIVEEIRKYFCPDGMDPKLFMIRLIREAKDEESAYKTQQIKENYCRDDSLIYVLSFRNFSITQTEQISYTETLFEYCAFLGITPPEMPEEMIILFPRLKERYQKNFDEKTTRN